MTKPTEDFCKHPTSYDGLRSRCKACPGGALDADALAGTIFTRVDIRHMTAVVLREAKR